MEPVALKCAACETEWKLFKIGTDAVLCPKCQAPAVLPEGVLPPIPTPDPIPVDSATTPPVAEALPPAIPEPPPPPTRPFREPLEHDEEERDYGEPEDYVPAPRRSGMHPLVVVIIILLLIFVLLPVAVIVLFWAMCALSA